MAIFVIVILVGILLGYLLGAIISAVIRKILNVRELKEQIAGSEILSLAFWGKLTTGISVYVKWLFVSVVLHYVILSSCGSLCISENAVASNIREIWFQKLSEYTYLFQNVMGGLGVFLLFAVVGMVIGAIVYKIIRAALESIRIEERMAKHGLSDALGGLQLGKVISGIFMIYVVIIFLATGIDAVAKPIGQEQNTLVLMFNNPDDIPNSLVELYPDFVLGGFILIGGALVGDFVQDKVRKSKSSLATDTVAWLIQGMIIFFAVVIALPHFQIEKNVDILTDSFKIIVTGISLGLAIAMGLGLKDMFTHLGKRVEKKL